MSRRKALTTRSYKENCCVPIYYNKANLWPIKKACTGLVKLKPLKKIISFSLAKAKSSEVSSGKPLLKYQNRKKKVLQGTQNTRIESISGSFRLQQEIDLKFKKVSKKTS